MAIHEYRDHLIITKPVDGGRYRADIYSFEMMKGYLQLPPDINDRQEVLIAQTANQALSKGQSYVDGRIAGLFPLA
tara:strand:- start:877 stop:1104 length:228 start_codon:yes stop_codon:yes gene_type:complete